ncbi:MAG: phosphoadenylyl-sulfate reductase [Rubrivivax sp.]|nr:phosphoadenylyl-sulfate reductase [Rubrivivax sp.]
MNPLTPSARETTAVQRHARATPGHAGRVAAALERLEQAAAAHAPRIVLATSLGAEDMVLTDLIARHRLPIAVATLDTGALHAETLALVAQAESHYGLAIERFAPAAEAVVNFVRRHGERSMYESIEQRKACCALRKLEPLARLLAGRTAWVTGLRRAQSAARAEVPFEQVDESGRVKLNPLADWSDADVWHYIGEHGVPYNPLHDRFFPSIGCAPCTRAVALGEDPRAGRWWWEQEGAKECGLHVAQALPQHRADAPAPAERLAAEAQA